MRDRAYPRLAATGRLPSVAGADGGPARRTDMDRRATRLRLASVRPGMTGAGNQAALTEAAPSAPNRRSRPWNAATAAARSSTLKSGQSRSVK
jgi:hypothetical protein